MIIEEEAYLEHYGVKGQKWGFRKFFQDRHKEKLKKYGSTSQAFKGNLRPDQRVARQKRSDRRRLGIAIGFGALWVAGTIASHKKIPVSNVGGSRTTARGAKSVKDILNQERDTKMAAIIKTHKEGFIDDAQKAQFLKVMDARYARKIAEAV